MYITISSFITLVSIFQTPTIMVFWCKRYLNQLV